MNSYRSNPSGFLEITVTHEIYQVAQNRNEEFFAICGNKGRLRDNESQRMTGFLAEAAINSVLPFLGFSNDSRFDFIFGNLTFDAKATGCNGPPRPDFDAMLYEYQMERNVDYYIFNRVKNDFSKVWITGFVSKKDFMKMAKYIPAGQKNQNFTYDQPRFTVQYQNMTKPFDFVANLFRNVPNVV